MSLPKPSCYFGFTREDLETIFGTEEEFNKFSRWMRGQTITLCRGEHCDDSHGLVTYRSDVYQYLVGGQTLD